MPDPWFDVFRFFEDRADRALHSWAYWQFKYSHDRLFPKFYGLILDVFKQWDVY
jgi:hypothetical protein